QESLSGLRRNGHIQLGTDAIPSLDRVPTGASRLGVGEPRPASPARARSTFSRGLSPPLLRRLSQLDRDVGRSAIANDSEGSAMLTCASGGAAGARVAKWWAATNQIMADASSVTPSTAANLRMIDLLSLCLIRLYYSITGNKIAGKGADSRPILACAS